jgi:uncharacterized membrane protein
MHWFKKKSIPKVTPLVTPDSTDQSIQEGHESQSVSVDNRMSNHTIDVPTYEDTKIIRKRNCCQRCCTKKNLKEQALLIATIAAVILGSIIGIVLRELKCSTGKKA